MNIFFEELMSLYIDKYRKDYGIMVNSPIIAQAILESGWGESELATEASNYFGLKYKEGRINNFEGTYEKIGSEQLTDGSYVSDEMTWFKFEGIEQCVKGYFDFTNNENYSRLKGVTSPLEYLTIIKESGYATSLDYVENLMRIIEINDLTKYDEFKEEKTEVEEQIEPNSKGIIVIDAGHGLYTSGKRCASYLDVNETREWVLNSRIAEKVQRYLQAKGYKIVRVDDTTGQTDVSLSNRVKIANELPALLYISIHHNAGINGGSGGGTVVFHTSSKVERQVQAGELYNYIVENTGLVGNRSTKYGYNSLYVTRETKMPAFLIENGFMDSKVDTPIILTEEHAEKTAIGIYNFVMEYFGEENNEIPNLVPDTTLNYDLVFNYTDYANYNQDVKNAFGYNEELLFNHFIEYGMSEGRKAISTFDVKVYKNNYVDLRNTFGEDYILYYKHYMEFGYSEGRKCL